MKDYSDKIIYKKIIKYAELRNNNVLEIGCGDGRISSLLTVESSSLVAIDPDEKAIDIAKTNIPNTDFRIGSGEKLNFPDSFFDVVIFTLSLHHQNSQKALNEAARTVKPDGKILVIEPVIKSEIGQVFAFLHDENHEIRDAQKSIIHSGLSIVDSEIFSAEWEFRDKEDVVNSLFQYYNRPFDSEIAKNITHYVGDKINSNPIILLDNMIIQSLRRNESSYLNCI